MSKSQYCLQEVESCMDLFDQSIIRPKQDVEEEVTESAEA